MTRVKLEAWLSGRWFWLVAVVCVSFAVGIVYGNALDAALLSDSLPSITEDPRLQAWEWVRIKDILLDDYWFDLDSSLYRPLTTLSFAVEYSLLGHGPRPEGYIAANLAIHAINALLVIALVRTAAASSIAALLAGLIFAVHPLGTESVTNVVGRADLLAALGVLAGLRLHVRIVHTERFRLGYSLGLLVASTTAIASKESGIVLIGVMGLYDFTVGAAGRKAKRASSSLSQRLLRSYVWCAIPVAVYFACRAVALADGTSPPSIADNPLLMQGPIAARFGAAGVLARYLGLIAWPATLSADYSYNAIPLFDGSLRSSADWFCIIVALCLVGFVVAAYASRLRAPAVSFLVLFFFVTIAPVSNVFLLIGTIMAERVTYLPSVAPIALVSWGLATLFGHLAHGRESARPMWIAGAIVFVLISCLSYRTALRNRDWRSAVALFRSAVQVNPSSFKVRRALAGGIYQSTPEPELPARIDEIIEHAERAWQIVSELPPTVGFTDLANLAYYYRIKARLVEGPEADVWRTRAEDTYRTAIEVPRAAGLAGDWRTHFAYAELLRDADRRVEALTQLELAAHLGPSPEVLAPCAALLLETGRTRDALLCALRAITLQADHGAMWEIVRNHYSKHYPDELTVANVQGAWRFNPRHSAVAADLRAATRLQYDAQQRLNPDRGGEIYRRLVMNTLGIDPLDTAARSPAVAPASGSEGGRH